MAETTQAAQDISEISMNSESPMAAENTISVIIPVYNGERFLAEAIQSVIAQTLPPDEIIVVDDGSTDGSAAIVAKMAGRSPLPIRYVYQENQGPAAARNHGLSLVHSDWIAFLDADDLWLPDKTRRQMQVFDDHPQAGIVWGCAITFAGDIPPDRSPASIVPPPMSPRFMLQSMLFQRRTLDQVGPFDPKLRRSEDVDWLFRAIGQSVVIVIHGDLVVYYRRHGSNLTNDPIHTSLGLNVLLKRSLEHRRAQSNLALERPSTLLILPGVQGIRSNQAQKK